MNETWRCAHCGKEHAPKFVCEEERAALELTMRSARVLDKLPSPGRSAEDLEQIRKVNGLHYES